MNPPGQRRDVPDTRQESRESFALYLKEVLMPALKRGQILVMDNVSVHKSKRVRELIDERGCDLWFSPTYSPDLNPTEEAFSKAKARTLDALFEATARALGSVGEQEPVGSSATAASWHYRLTHYENR